MPGPENNGSGDIREAAYGFVLTGGVKFRPESKASSTTEISALSHLLTALSGLLLLSLSCSETLSGLKIAQPTRFSEGSFRPARGSLPLPASNQRSISGVSKFVLVFETVLNCFGGNKSPSEDNPGLGSRRLSAEGGLIIFEKEVFGLIFGKMRSLLIDVCLEVGLTLESAFLGVSVQCVPMTVLFSAGDEMLVPSVFKKVKLEEGLGFVCNP